MLSGKPQCEESELLIHVVAATLVIYFWCCRHRDNEGQRDCGSSVMAVAGTIRWQEGWRDRHGTAPCSPAWLAWVCPRHPSLSSPSASAGSTGVTQEEVPNPLPAWSWLGSHPGSFPGMVPRSHHHCGLEGCGGSWHLPGVWGAIAAGVGGE